MSHNPSSYCTVSLIAKMYSPRLFIEYGPSIAQNLANTAHSTRIFKDSMSRAADLLNAAIASVNSEDAYDDSVILTKRELRSCREKFMKALASSTTFVDRFNKLVCYADIDDTWKEKMVDAASKGDYTSFSSYVTQLKRFLDQLNQTYQDFVQACADAEAQCKGLPVTSRSALPVVEQDVTILGLRVTPAALVGAGIAAGIGTWIIMKYILEFKNIASFAASLAAAALVLVAGSHFGKPWAGYDKCRKPLAIQYHGYDAVRNTASKINLSSLELRKTLTSLSSEGESRLQVKGQANAANFISSLNMLLSEVKKACDIVTPCYEELDRGITVTRVNSF